MGLHVIAGSGPIGSAVAAALLERGEQVRIVTRSGSGPEGTERIAGNLGGEDGAALLSEAAHGATAIYNCVNPAYHQWATDWPPIADALLTATERTGAVLAVTGNLYGYGPVSAPMTESTPAGALGTKGRVRNTMTDNAFAAHRAGRIRTFEARGSDYLGGSSMLSMIAFPAWRSGKRALLPGPTDVPHTFTDVRDMAAMLVTGVFDERAHGKIWHVPSGEPRTLGTVLRAAADRLDLPGKVLPLPRWAVYAAGFTDPFIKELRETQHQFRRPFDMDSTAAQRTFDLKPHAFDDSIAFDIARNWAA
ncbi:MAG: NAD-dependent epimerase [Nakamurella sp.]